MATTTTSTTGGSISTVTVVSAQAQAADYTGRRRQIAVLVVALAFVMDLMDATILTIALPTIESSMHASLSEVRPPDGVGLLGGPV